MTENLHGEIVADGRDRARRATEARVRAEVEREMAGELAEAGSLLHRLRTRARINREVNRRMKQEAPSEAMY